ncbi:TonB-dependent receptor [Wenzhouxiangella sp. XN79A]|uniref:TonB-dependent receptor n=1 Tax=Wenzhouxiangella sp. XN79A TaxID=2724193 RepID=UPI00144AAE22|nr:TonB-dependent receptor [Wenzhouxiangella sp. XN79A]NKI34158.1 TonB-dependent receptor [Wenzhouxiangella sp. XN79A]
MHSIRVLVALTAALLIPLAVQAQPATGTLTGTVVNSDQSVRFEGATVEIVGTDRRTSTNRDGRFRFSLLPAGDYELRVEYVGAAAETMRVAVEAGETTDVAVLLAVELDPVMVIGQRAIQSASLSRERSAVNNINVITADAIGQFPDNNVAEALQRVSGLSLQRDQGEGRFITIRGANANFNTTTINGLRIPGPEDDSRAVNLDVLSADLVESVEVSKSLTPDQDADAVGGNIEISTLSAFDLGNSIRFNVEGSYNGKADEVGPRLGVTGTRLFSVGDGVDNLAVSGSLTYFDRRFEVDNVEAGDWPEFEAPSGQILRVPEAAEQRDYRLSRERTGAVLNFDYRPTAFSEYYLRTLYSEFADNEIELEHEYIFEDATPIEITENGGLFSDGEVERRGKETTATREILAISAGGSNIFDAWELEYQAGYAEASTSEPFSLGTALIAEGLDIGYDFTGSEGRRAPNLFGTDLAALDDPSAYELDLVELESDRVEEDEISLRLDLGRDLFWGNNPGRIQFGAKARFREKSNDANNSNFVDFDADYTLADLAGTGQRDYSLGRFGPWIDTRRLREFFAANGSNFGIDPADFLLDSEGEDYSLEEDIYAAYVMAEATLGRLDLLGGLRVETTDIEQDGFRAVVDEDFNDGDPVIEPFSGENDYTDLFPNLQARFNLSDNLQLRGSFTRTMTRPGFEDAGARQVVEIEGGERVAEVGNPDLDPFYSNNFDLELSYYAGEVLGAASIGVFYKDITDFFVRTDVAGEGIFADFDEVESVINGGDAELFGIELSYVQEFSFLPGPWDGLLLIANYTYVDSEADLPGRDSSIRLPFQSDHIANVALGYDKAGLSMRLALNHRGEYLDSINDPEDPSQDEIVREETRLDFTSEYQITENIAALLSVQNITDEPYYAFYGDERFARQFDEFGRTWEFGLRLRF